MTILAPLVPLVLLVGCSVGGPAESEAPSTSASPPASSPGTPDSTGPGAGGPAETPACAEVRAGIDAFNAGDLDQTVAHFVDAVPLAKKQLDGSRQADDLLEAITWYAQLAPEDYPEASATSPEFARYKAITLGQCVAAGQDPGGQPSESSGTSI